MQIKKKFKNKPTNNKDKSLSCCNAMFKILKTDQKKQKKEARGIYRAYD